MTYGPWNPKEYDVLLLASYCGDDDPNCSDAKPCPECLSMCNVLRISGDALRAGRNFGGLELSHATRLINPPVVTPDE
jgi:hypothetical protein